MSNTPEITSKYYPYFKTQDSFLDFSEAVDIPRKLCDYLLDAPKGNYKPIDDNKYPRCRLWKYLMYDGAKPLSNTLPTIQEKMKVLFDPNRPEEPPTEKGYRLIPQVYTKQSQEKAQTRVYVYLGRTVPSGEGEFKASIAVKFLIFTHYTYELNTKADEYSRCAGIEYALIEALHGVNMAGVGTFSFSKRVHPDCGSREMFDGNTNVGRELTLALEIATTAENGVGDTDNMPTMDGNIKFA